MKIYVTARLISLYTLGLAHLGESPIEYLSYEHEFPFTCWEMISGKFVIPAAVLLDHLKLAKHHLINTEGPHKAERVENEPNFIGWWINFFEEHLDAFDKHHSGSKLLSLDEVGRANKAAKARGLVTGCTFANSCEGARHHRHMISYITSVVRNNKGHIGLLIDESIAPKKSRKKRFLPLQMILSMWAYYFTYDLHHSPSRTTGLDYLSVIPDRPSEVSVNDYYDNVFKRTEALFYFVAEGDPHFAEKFRRNIFPNCWPKDDEPWFVFSEVETHMPMGSNAIIFSRVDSKRTSNMVQRLLADDHEHI